MPAMAPPLRPVASVPLVVWVCRLRRYDAAVGMLLRRASSERPGEGSHLAGGRFRTAEASLFFEMLTASSLNGLADRESE